MRFRYRNYKGDVSVRHVVPNAHRPLVWSSNKYHPQKQWLLRAYDVDKRAVRTFAVKDILEHL